VTICATRYVTARPLDSCTASPIAHGKNDGAEAAHTNIPLSDLPNAFSDFMHKKIANIRRVFDSCPVPAIFEPFAGAGLCAFAPVSEDLIRKLTNDASQKVVSLIPYPRHFSKHATWTSFLSFTKTVNYSPLSGSVPQCFKQVLVTPFLKKPSLDQNMLRNYRHVQSFVSVKASGKRCAYS